ncbi:MAG: M48 family metallopeptidase [Deltaproteobacteria bacterium]|nr:M48 family metallopeptidase [Deltaproteobacteria bacterium]
MEQPVVAVFLILFALEFLVEFALNELNMRHVREQIIRGETPDFFRDKMNPDDYRKSLEYTLAKGRFQRWAAVYGAVVTLFVLFGGVLPFVDRLSRNWGGSLPPGTQATGILFCLITALIISVLSSPPDLYSTFVLEESFGFNKTTFKLYVTDKLKGILLGIMIGVPFLFAVLWLMESAGHYWWLWAFLFILAFQLLMVIVYPTLIAPLFNKFEPLKEGELREKILALADQVGFRTEGIYVMDGSRRSAHSNAYFTGLGKAKRIVLFDTLLQQMTLGQGLAVLAHEMGHYKMKHIRRMLLIQGIYLLAALYVLSLLIDYEPLYRAFGLDTPSTHGALVLFSLVSGPATFYITPLMNRLSRKHEYEADRFAVRTLRDGKPMEEALISLSIKNLSNPAPHPWYSAYHYSHPSTAERVGAIRKEMERQKSLLS